MDEQNQMQENKIVKPLVSVVTVVYNGEKHLERTIKSIVNQTYDNLEYIIIDGGSTDSSLEIIKKYEDSISYWVTEKDEGIYDAMNKGLKVATGEYIGILNADDYYSPNAVEKSVEKIIETGTDYSVGKIQFVNTKVTASPIFPLVDSFVYQEMMYPHISAFISKEAYLKAGLFDTSYKIAGDFDMALKIHLNGYKCCYVDDIIIGYLEEGGVSSTTSTNIEFRDVAISHGKSIVMAYYDYIYQVSKVKTYNLLPKKIIKFLQKLKKSRYS